MSFENYLRNAYSLTPLRNQYTLNGIILKDNYHQFGGGEKITGFTKLDNNSQKTIFGYRYTKTITKQESSGKKIGSLPILDIVTTTSSDYYIVIKIESNKSVSFKICENEDEYREEIQNL